VLLIPRDREPLFRAGLFAFLSGHVCYALAFLQLGIAALPTAVAGACFAVVGFLAWRWMDPHLPTGMRVPVLLYLLVIGGMVAAAWGSGPPLGSGGGLPLAAVGATGFAISDLFVARERFVTLGFANAALGLPLYFGSQLVLAATAATA
jgi:uncharacterized membrane protein YhhN